MRLMNLKQIQAEKIPRSRSWIFNELKAGRFPTPAVGGDGSGGNLWDEGAVDAWLAGFVSTANTSSKPRIKGRFA